VNQKLVGYITKGTAGPERTAIGAAGADMLLRVLKGTDMLLQVLNAVPPNCSAHAICPLHRMCVMSHTSCRMANHQAI